MARRISAGFLLAATVILGSCSPDTCPSFSIDIVEVSKHNLENTTNHTTQSPISLA